MGILVPRVILDHKGRLEMLAPLVLVDLLVLRAKMVRMASMAALAILEHGVIMACRVCVVSMEPLVLKASRVTRAKRVAQVPAVSKASVDPKARLDHAALRVLVVVVHLVRKVLRESKAPRETRGDLVLELVVPLGLWVARANEVSLARMVPKAIQAPLEHKGRMVTMVSKETEAILALWAALGCEDKLGTRVSLGLPGTLGTLVRRVRRAMLVSEVLRGLRAQLATKERMAPMVPADQLDPKDVVVTLARTAEQGLKVCWEAMVSMDREGSVEHQGSRARKARRASEDLGEIRVRWASRGQSECPEIRALVVSLAQQVGQVSMVSVASVG